MDIKLLALYEHRDLLNGMGYEIESPIIDLLVKTDEKYKKSRILFNGISVGDIGFEERNMCYLYRDNRFIGNKDFSEVNFSSSRRKNIRTVVHVRLFHNNLKINCFNMLHSIGRSDSDDRTFICISDGYKIMASKYLNDEDVEIISLLDDIENEEILDYLRKPKKNKTQTYKLGDVLNEYKN